MIELRSSISIYNIVNELDYVQFTGQDIVTVCQLRFSVSYTKNAIRLSCLETTLNLEIQDGAVVSAYIGGYTQHVDSVIWREFLRYKLVFYMEEGKIYRSPYIKTPVE